MDASKLNNARIRVALFWPGLVCLLIAVTASFMLAGRQLDLLEAPGCGGGSPCDRAMAGPWGKVPLVDWPVSFVGLAYFAALGAAWIATRRRAGVPAGLRRLVRIGAALSVLFVVVMFAGGYLCVYCLAVHLANLGFVAVSELAPTRAGGNVRSLGLGAAVFAGVTGAQIGLQNAAAGRAEQELAASTERIVEAAQQQAGREPAGPFTGRHRLGPAEAPIRIVIISDYQCPDCKRVDEEARIVLAARTDVSVSAKHYPFCTDCNQHTPRTLHPNACRAALAAEAAGILKGDEGFWKMHRWLFDRGGVFTNAQLAATLRESGHDVEQFLSVMGGPEALQRLEADIEEAKGLGIYVTPMVFINGVELRGWQVPDALPRAVNELAATDPVPGDASRDRPPPASEKYIDDWRLQPRMELGADTRSWSIGPDDAPARIVAWGDYEQPLTAESDRLIRSIVVSRGDVRYTFRHYPVDRSCNPGTPTTLYENACLAAKAVEAAGTLAGAEGYWAMHAWALENQQNLSAESLAAAASGMGIDQQRFAAAVESPEVTAAVDEDVRAAYATGLASVPWVFLNEKRVPRWRAGALDTMIEAAVRAEP
ncbi:MAG: DsbA family protein [Planctomycetota bacterium]